MLHKIGSKERPLNVAIIGSGPSGFYAAESLLKNEEIHVEVDMIEMLPTPYGLVRAGVAPDHQQIKSVVRVYDKIALNPSFRFWGNVNFGTDLTKKELLERFDAVIYATGAQSDKRLGVEGEDLAGSHSATEFVNWYNGHPDFRDHTFDLSSENVAIVGMGNVALDVARILVRTPDEFTGTDIADYAQEQLAESKVRNIYVIARRGPLQAAFTSAGTKELSHLSDALAMVDPAELKLEGNTQKLLEETNDKRIIQNFKFLDEISKNYDKPASRSIKFLFRRSPLNIFGKDGKVEGISLVKNELFEDEFGKLHSIATDVSENIPAGLIFRSIGYKTLPLAEVTYDDDKGLVKNDTGRVLDSSGKSHMPGEYVVGWAKRGATGIIGTNKPDAVETVNLLLEDFRDKTSERPGENTAANLKELLESKKVNYVPFEDWKILDQHEITEGEKHSKAREKVTTVNEMLQVIEAAKTE